MKNCFIVVLALVLLAFASVSMAVENLPQSEVDEIVKGVESGDAKAQFRLGLMYALGQNVKRDDEQAFYWLKKSYEQGNVEAQLLLAAVYSKGSKGVVEKDEGQAFKLMKQIAEKDPSTIKKVYGDELNGRKSYGYGSAEELVALAQCELGQMYYYGEGIQKDDEQAEIWLKKSLEHGSAATKEKAEIILEFIRIEKKLRNSENVEKSQTSTANTQPKPQSQPSNSNGVPEINFEQAFKECRDNGLVFKRKYEGKKVRVTEKIYAVGTQPFTDKIFVRLSYKENQIGLDDFDDLYCFFEDSDADSVMKLKAGQSVTIEGTCKESSFVPFTLEKCRIMAVNDSNANKSLSEKPQSVIEVGIEQLLQSYKDNKIAAMRKYDDNKIRLSGFIDNIDKYDGKIYVRLSEKKDSWTTIRCYFDDSETESVMQMKKGQSVTIEGTCQSGENSWGTTIAQLIHSHVVSPNSSSTSQASGRSSSQTSTQPTKTETAHTLQKPRNEEEAEENISIFIDSVKQVAEKLCTTPYKVQDVEFMPADEMREESENVYMRAWWYAENFFMFCNYNDNSWSKAYVATFRTNSPEFTFAGDIKVGSYFSKIRDLFGETAYWSSEEKTLLLADSKGNSATIHVSDGKVDYIEYSYYGDYTHKMLNLLYLYRDEIYSASITTETNSKLNVRSEPDTQSEVLFQVLKNNNLLFIENSSGVIGNGGNEWYRVRFVYDDSAKTISSVNEAYVYGKYINIMPLTYGERESLINAFN